MIQKPTHAGYDDRGKYYQWGNQERYYVDEHGEAGARQRAEAQGAAIRHSGYDDKAITSGSPNVHNPRYSHRTPHNEDSSYADPNRRSIEENYWLNLKNKYKDRC